MSFTFNNQTAGSNVFQLPVIEEDIVSLGAQNEFDKMVSLLRVHHIEVHIFHDTPNSSKPDALFPNNWISIHESGQLILYPMMAPNRRLERRLDIVEFFKTHFEINEVIDFSGYEELNMFMEGTGSLVFDHANQVAYACRSERTNEKVLREICNKLGYHPIVFEALDDSGKQIYHTNVMMSVGSKFSIVCLDSIIKEEDQELVLAQFSNTSHRVIAISFDQMKSFAGNMFEVENTRGETCVIMSQQACDSLMPGQINAISKFGYILPIAIPKIERCGGGSVRCMMAGIHAQRSVSAIGE